MVTPTAMVAPHTPLDDLKRAMRERALAARAAWNQSTARAALSPGAAGVALMSVVLRECPPPAGATVAGFWPLAEEIDTSPLLHALHAKGHPIVLPVTPKRGAPLTFRRWNPGDAMEAERFGTMRPIGPEQTPSFLLVPLLAFDRRGGRLGYGGGFYDRTLPGLPGRFALGCGFALQEVPEVPMGPRDERLDAVATERCVFRCA